MANAQARVSWMLWRRSLTDVYSNGSELHFSEKNLHAMRLGPGKHLKGLILMDGIVKPEEFDYFRACHDYTGRAYRLIHPIDEQIVTQEVCRCGARGYGDGKSDLSHSSDHLVTFIF